MRKAVYGGSFDPPTNGHLWMIEQGAKLFDVLVVALGINPSKEYAFSVDERVEMLRNITKDFRNITIDTFQDQFLVSYAESVGADHIIRGIRSEVDYEYERVMRHVNSDLNSNILTVFLMPPREIAEVSSSFVKGLVGPEGWEKIVRVRDVDEHVYIYMKTTNETIDGLVVISVEYGDEAAFVNIVGEITPESLELLYGRFSIPELDSTRTSRHIKRTGRMR